MKLAERIAANILATLKRRNDWRRLATIVGKRLLSAAHESKDLLYQPPEQPETD